MKNHRTSKIKRKRKSGFLARTSTSKGRKILNRRRRNKTSVNISK